MMLSTESQVEEIQNEDIFTSLRNQTLNRKKVLDCESNFHASKNPLNKTNVEADVIWHQDW